MQPQDVPAILSGRSPWRVNGNMSGPHLLSWEFIFFIAWNAIWKYLACLLSSLCHWSVSLEEGEYSRTDSYTIPAGALHAVILRFCATGLWFTPSVQGTPGVMQHDGLECPKGASNWVQNWPHSLPKLLSTVTHHSVGGHTTCPIIPSRNLGELMIEYNKYFNFLLPLLFPCDPLSM